MIKSFADKRTEQIFARERIKRLDNNLRDAVHRKLVSIHIATTLNEINIPPNNKLEALKGDRSGQFSIRVNRQWRICFRWEDGNAWDVELVDYH